MFVAKRMTPNPVTISPDTAVSEAKDLMRRHKFRRLPVVQDGHLVGIVTDRDLREVSPSPASTLSVFEANYLLEKMLVRDIMHRRVVTIYADATIEEAALIMYKEKLGCLVVLDVYECVAGIITETDIFKTFVDVMGLKEGKTRLTIAVENQVGVLHDITGIFAELNINISSLVTEEREDKGELVIRAQMDDVEAVIKKLTEKGYPVLHVAQIG